MLNALIKNFVAKPCTDFSPPPVEIATNLFAVDRQLQFPGGFRMPNRTTIVRLQDGGLVVISAPPIISPECISSIDTLGSVRYVVVPNSFHYVFAESFIAQYPGAELLTPPGISQRVESFPSGRGIETLDLPDLLEHLEFKTLQASDNISEITFFHLPTNTLIITDLAFNISKFPRTIDRFAWLLSGVPSGFGPARTSRRLLLTDKPSTNQYLNELLLWNFERIVVGHGDIIVDDAKSAFRSAFAEYLNDE